MQKQTLGPALFAGDGLQAAIVVKVLDEATANLVVFDGEGNPRAEPGAAFVQADGDAPAHYERGPGGGEHPEGHGGVSSQRRRRRKE